jgi:hypothetical protein
MKATVNFLIVLAQLAISCRGMEWDPRYDYLDYGLHSGWGAEENRYLRERTSSSLPQASLDEINSSLMDGDPSSTLQMHDWVNSDVNHSPYIARNTLDTAESSGRVAIGHNEIPHNAQNDVFPIVRHIRMAEKESPLHQLVFDRDVFATSRNKEIESNAKSRLDLIEERMKRCSIGSHPDHTILMLPIEDLSTFLASFRSCKQDPHSTHKPSDVAGIEMEKFFHFQSADIWRAVYGKRLGIDFIALKEWLVKVLRVPYPRRPRENVTFMANRLEGFFLCYMFFVDMILTTICKPTHAVVDRSHSFHAAVASFEQLTEQTLNRQGTFLRNASQRSTHLFEFLAHWVNSDEDLRSSHLLSRSEISINSKAYFNFLFSDSIDNLTTRFGIKLGLPTSS